MSILKDVRLRAFHTAALQKSFTRAAQHLLLTQQAVSFQIKSLEEELGTRLFERDGRSIALTGTGRALFAYADRILSIYAEAENHLAELTGAVPDRLRIAATNSIAKYALPRPLGAFRTRHPALQITLEVGNSDYVVNCVADGLVDAAIVSDGPAALKGYALEPFLRDEVTFIVPPDHPWNGQDDVAFEAFCRVPFILRGDGSGTRCLLERRMAALGSDLSRLNVVLILGSAEAVKGAVAAGAGLGMVSGLAARADVAAGTLGRVRVPDIEIVRDFYVIRPKDRRVHQMVDAFIDLARGSAEAGTQAAVPVQRAG